MENNKGFIRYKRLGSNQWFETDKRYHDDESNHYYSYRFSIGGSKFYFFRNCQLTEIDVENIDIDNIRLFCDDNYIKHLKITKKMDYINSDNIQLMDNSNNEEFCISFKC